MISLEKYDKKALPNADYYLESVDKLKDVISFLTPKFTGNWVIVFLDPKIKHVKGLLEDTQLPRWVDFIVLMGQKKLDTVALEYPHLVAKKQTRKEMVNEVVSGMRNLISNSAKKALTEALGNSKSELIETVRKLDNECADGIVTLKQVQKTIHYVKRVYVSSVINAFLLKDRNRWDLFSTVVHDIGEEITYYAMYKYVKNLLLDKQKYLRNEDIKYYIVQRIDAPVICYAYVLFAKSSNHKQVYEILYAIDNRSVESLERMYDDNL